MTTECGSLRAVGALIQGLPGDWILQVFAIGQKRKVTPTQSLKLSAVERAPNH